MTTTITRTCDKCGTTVADGEELWTLGIIAKCSQSANQHPGYAFKTHNLPYVKDEHRKDYCRNCVVQTGMNIVNKSDVPVTNPPTLDTLLREIVEETVQDAMEP